MYKRSLSRCEKVLGPDHPSTLSSVCCLAQLTKQHGYDELFAMCKRACAGNKAVFGSDHITSCTCRQLYVDAIASQQQDQLTPIADDSMGMHIGRESELLRGLAKMVIEAQRDNDRHSEGNRISKDASKDLEPTRDEFPRD
jgi:hypothetical protein